MSIPISWVALGTWYVGGTLLVARREQLVAGYFAAVRALFRHCFDANSIAPGL